jgi:hypothetical protein
MEEAIASALEGRKADIQAWLKSGPARGTNMPFDWQPNMGNLGAGFETGAGGQIQAISRNLEGVRIILKADGSGGFVLHSAFPR